MPRSALLLAAATGVIVAAAPALGADFSDVFGAGGDMRSGFSEEDWANSDAGDPLSFELGARYWYSWGAQSFQVLSSVPSLTESDKTQSVEFHARVNDDSTKFYAKGLAGMSYAMSGDYSGFDAGTLTEGRIAYAGADLGYSWLGNYSSPFSFGPFAGYMYWNDSPNASSQTAVNNYTTATSASDISYDQNTGATTWPGASTANNVEINMLRLGLSGQARLGPMFDLSGEVAAVPYANIHGVLGSVVEGPTYSATIPGNVSSIQSSPTTLDGWGYGVAAEAFLGVHPTDHMTLRLGGRAWYLQGTADATFSRATIGDPSDSDPANPPNYDTAPSFTNTNYITRGNPWSLFRYGLLAEFTYNF